MKTVATRVGSSPLRLVEWSAVVDTVSTTQEGTMKHAWLVGFVGFLGSMAVVEAADYTVTMPPLPWTTHQRLVVSWVRNAATVGEDTRLGITIVGSETSPVAEQDFWIGTATNGTQEFVLPTMVSGQELSPTVKFHVRVRSAFNSLNYTIDNNGGNVSTWSAYRVNVGNGYSHARLGESITFRWTAPGSVTGDRIELRRWDHRDGRIADSVVVPAGTTGTIYLRAKYPGRHEAVYLGTDGKIKARSVPISIAASLIDSTS